MPYDVLYMYIHVHVIRLGVGASKFLLAIKERNDDEERRGGAGDRLKVARGRKAGGRLAAGASRGADDIGRQDGGGNSAVTR